jgi:hypothetical protein
MAGIRERDKRAVAGFGFDGLWEFRTTFVLRSQYVLFEISVLAGFRPQWPILKMSVAGFGRYPERHEPLGITRSRRDPCSARCGVALPIRRI